jgi:hypothetical protein
MKDVSDSIYNINVIVHSGDESIDISLFNKNKKL